MSRRAHSSSFESSRTATTDQRFAATAGPTATSPRETSEDSGDEVPTTTYLLEDLRRAVRIPPIASTLRSTATAGRAPPGPSRQPHLVRDARRHVKRQNVRVSSDRHAAVVPGPARSAPFTPSPLGVTTGRHSSPDVAGPGSTTSTSLAPESGPSPACESPSRWSSPHHSGVPRAPEPEAITRRVDQLPVATRRTASSPPRRPSGASVLSGTSHAVSRASTATRTRRRWYARIPPTVTRTRRHIEPDTRSRHHPSTNRGLSPIANAALPPALNATSLADASAVDSSEVGGTRWTRDGRFRTEGCPLAHPY